jgi:hypothetical protein
MAGFYRYVTVKGKTGTAKRSFDLVDTKARSNP